MTQLQHFPSRMEPRRLEGNRVTREDAVSVAGRTRCVMNTQSGVSSAVELRQRLCALVRIQPLRRVPHLNNVRVAQRRSGCHNADGCAVQFPPRTLVSIHLGAPSCVANQGRVSREGGNRESGEQDPAPGIRNDGLRSCGAVG